MKIERFRKYNLIIFIFPIGAIKIFS